MRKLFGTDGVRGTANSEPMTAETALRLAMAAGRRFTRGDHRHRVVIGKDTRLSGYMLEPALTAGFISIGMDVVLLGPMPTPGVAMLTRSLRADLGVVISASHNPFEDNGIKLFGPDGYKLSDAIEAEIEALMENGSALVEPGRLGRARRLEDAPGRYIEFIKASFPKGLTLDGVKVVVDCAHGAAYRVAPSVLRELGATVAPLGVAPDGFNINRDCGATHPQALQDAVVAQGAHLGLALDGDADRLILVDESGRVVDGDQVLALIARRWKDAGTLRGEAVVGTVMSNIGLERYLAHHGIGFHRAAVGDRYVLETMQARSCNLGGEQSGHIILTDHATTGDGMIAGLQVLAAIAQSGAPASEALRNFTPAPQILKSVRINGGDPMAAPAVGAAIAAGETALAETGRLLIRKSGTEPVIRVMAEGDDAGLVGRVVEDIAAAIAHAAR